MQLTRREAIAGFAGFLKLLAASPAGAQAAYPVRLITLVVPFPPGGATDLLARMVAERLKSGLRSTVVVENRPGAASTIGAAYVAKAPPDGYTLLMATSTTLAISKALYKKLPYDPVTDFTPITLVAAVPFSLVVNPSLPVSSLREFIAYAKSRPGSYRTARPVTAVRTTWGRRCSRLRPGSTSGMWPTGVARRPCGTSSVATSP